MSATPERWLEVSVRSASAGDRAPLLAEGLLSFGGRACQEREGWQVTYVPAPAQTSDFVEEVSRFLQDFTGLGGMLRGHAIRQGAFAGIA